MTMLGSKCSPCCQGPCPCAVGNLPDTVTITIDGPMGEKSQGPPLLTMKFDACFGSGAAGYAIAPGGKLGEASGPISSVVLTKAGSGYAVLGRAEPTLTLSATNTTEAEYTVTLAKEYDDCDRPYWELSGITVTDGGEGYVDGEQISISLGEGDVQEQPATATVVAKNAQPTLTASASPGSGATFTVTLTSNGGDPETWGVSKVAVSGTPLGYVDGDYLDFSGGVEQSPAFAQIVLGRLEPTVQVDAIQTTGGSGASLTATLRQEGTPPNVYWAVDSFTIVSAGEGYAAGELATVSAVDGTSNFQAVGVVDSVDGNGAILSFVVLDAFGFLYEGEYYKFGDSIEEVVVNSPGEYYVSELTGITVTDGGRYYRPDASLAAIVSSVNVRVVQAVGYDGSGATFAAVIDDNPASATFGQMTGVTVTNGGSGYLGWVWIFSCNCEWDWDNEGGAESHTVVAWRVYEDDDITGFKPTCYYEVPRCFPTKELDPPEYSAQLLRAKISSPLKTAYVALLGPRGTPGISNGPIHDLDLDPEQIGDRLDGWAVIIDDEVYAPAATVTVEQAPPSRGSSATLSASINADPESEEFGKLTLSLTSGGSGYLGGYRPESTSYVAFEYRGPAQPSVATFFHETPFRDLGDVGCSVEFVDSEPIADCGDFTFVGTALDATVTVVPGGEIEPLFRGSNKCCSECYDCCPDRPSQVTVTFTREAAEGYSYQAADNAQFEYDGQFGWLVSNQDSFYMTCPEDEIEVVFDFDLLEEEKECPRTPFVACLGSESYFGNDALFCPEAEYVLEPPETTLDPGSALLIKFDNPLKPQRTERSAAYLEISTLFSTTEYFLDIDRFRCEHAITIDARTAWATFLGEPAGDGENSACYVHDVADRTPPSPGSPTFLQHAIKTYTLEEQCGTFPEGWIENEEQVFTSDAPFGEGIPINPGDKYLAFIRFVCNPWTGPVYPVFFRRICNDYEIDVEFS